jgi:hypothetical protein
MNALSLNDLTFVLDADMNANVSIETHKICQTINFEEKSDRVIYLKFVAKSKDHILEIRNSMTKFK